MGGIQNRKKGSLDKGSSSISPKMAKNTSREQFSKAMKENLCLHCFKKGHKSVECPGKGSLGQSRQNREDKISKLYEKIFPYANSAAKLDFHKDAFEAQESFDSEN